MAACLNLPYLPSKALFETITPSDYDGLAQPRRAEAFITDLKIPKNDFQYPPRHAPRTASLGL